MSHGPGEETMIYYKCTTNEKELNVIEIVVSFDSCRQIPLNKYIVLDLIFEFNREDFLHRKNGDLAYLRNH